MTDAPVGRSDVRVADLNRHFDRSVGAMPDDEELADAGIGELMDRNQYLKRTTDAYRADLDAAGELTALGHFAWLLTARPRVVLTLLVQGVVALVRQRRNGSEI